MFMIQLARSLLRITVLAVYTVASLTVGLFHDQSAHSSCGCCHQQMESGSPAPESTSQSCAHGHCHLHQHGHDHCPAHAHASSHTHAQHQPVAPEQKGAPGRPGHCDHCAACQFLAAVPPLVEIATIEA